MSHENVCRALCQADSLCHRVAQEHVKLLMFTLCASWTLTRADLLCLIFVTWLPCRQCWQPSPSSASSHACWHHVLRRPTATPCPSEWSCSTTTAMMLLAQSWPQGKQPLMLHPAVLLSTCSAMLRMQWYILSSCHTHVCHAEDAMVHPVILP